MLASNNRFSLYVIAVYVCAQGNMDLRGILQSVTKKDYMRYQAYMTEKVNKEMREESISTGNNKSCQMTFIADMENLSMRQMTFRPGISHLTVSKNLFQNAIYYVCFLIFSYGNGT